MSLYMLNIWAYIENLKYDIIPSQHSHPHKQYLLYFTTQPLSFRLFF